MVFGSFQKSEKLLTMSYNGVTGLLSRGLEVPVIKGRLRVDTVISEFPDAHIGPKSKGVYCPPPIYGNCHLSFNVLQAPP